MNMCTDAHGIFSHRWLRAHKPDRKTWNNTMADIELNNGGKNNSYFIYQRMKHGWEQKPALPVWSQNAPRSNLAVPKMELRQERQNKLFSTQPL